jgi:hypothetical protein
MSLDHALAAAERGWSVFPLRGKRPTVKWATEATRDAHTIVAWLAATSDNYGIACGPSELLVIDEDTPGDFAKYAADVGATIPDTFTVKTGRGTHFYFAANGHAFGNAEHALKGYGVNVRGSGGYVVGPGSTHSNGSRYEIARDAPPAPMPTWLVNALTPTRQPVSGAEGDPFAPGGLAAVPVVIGGPRDGQPGERHAALVAYACSLRARNVPMDEAELLMRAVWQRCEQPPACTTPLPWGEALATLRDCFARYGVSDAYADSTADAVPADDALLGHVMRRSELAKLPPLKPLIKGLLDYPSAAVLVGSYGIGKTFLGLALACCVASGRPWLGQPVERRKVMLVVGEGGSGLDKRLAAWEQGYNQGKPVSDDDLLVVVQPRSLTDRNVWQRIAERCMAEGVGFVILDTFSSLAPDADETKDAATVLRNMHEIATAINGTVLLVHHPGWSDNGRTRGGYQFEGNADSVLLLTGTPDEPLVQLRRKKVKDGEGGQIFWLRRSVQQLHGQHLGESSIVMQSVDSAQVGVPFIERVKLVLDACGDQGATGPQMMTELGVPDDQRSTFYRHLSRAVAEGVAVKRGKGNQQRYYLAGDP